MPKGTNQKFKLYRLAQIMLEKTDDEHYITMPEIMKALATYEVTVSVNVHVSRQFLGWVFSLGEGVKIISPDDVVDEMKQEIERLIR